MNPLNDVTILITSFLRFGYLNTCLHGAREKLPECGLLVVDDSDETQKETIHSGGSWTIVEMPFDSGLAAKRNMGVRYCKTQYLLLGCDDFDFSTSEARQGIERLLSVLEENPDIDVASGRVDNHPYEGFLEYKPGHFIREHRLTPNHTAPFFDVDLTVNYFLARAARIVPWDDRMKIGGEHGDWFLSMKEAGRRVVWVPGVNITTLHLGTSKNVQSPLYGGFRGRALELGHRIFKEKRGIRDYIDFGGGFS